MVNVREGKPAAALASFSFDPRGKHAAGQESLACKASRKTLADGKQVTETSVRIGPNYLDALEEVGSTAPLLDKDGNKVGKFVTFTANATFATDKKDGVLPKPATIKAPRHEAYSDIVRDQIASQEHAKGERKAREAEAAKAAPEVTQEAVAAPEVAVEDPSPVG
jgi:hypothetical protein